MKKLTIGLGLLALLFLGIFVYSSISNTESLAWTLFGFGEPKTPDPPPPPGYTKCGNYYCHVASEVCKSRWVPIKGTIYWCEPKPISEGGCPGQGQHRCPADGAADVRPICCGAGQTCGTSSYRGTTFAICINPPPPGGCPAGRVTCGANCCLSGQECATAQPVGLQYCRPINAASCPSGQSFCSGTDSYGNLINKCCAAGQTCGTQPGGAPICIIPPPPPPEICGDGVDNDRDGQIDEGCSPTTQPIEPAKSPLLWPVSLP